MFVQACLLEGGIVGNGAQHLTDWTILGELGGLLWSIVDLHVCNTCFPTCPLSAKASSWAASELSWGSLGRVRGLIAATLGLAIRAKLIFLILYLFYMCF